MTHHRGDPMTKPPELLSDRDAVAAVLAAHQWGDWDCSCGFKDWAYVTEHAHLADVLAPLLAQARAEAVAAALAPVERLADEWTRTGGDNPGVIGLVYHLRAAVAEGKEAGRG